MCLYPRLIQNRKYIANKKNGGIIPAVSDNRVLAVPVGCGKCMECRKKKARDWQIRLLEDVRHNKNGIFITLTFSNESIRDLTKEEKIKGLKGYERDNAIAKLATRRFLERWRKEYKKSLRHWLVTELGHEGTENIHMHGIVWTNENSEKIKKHWGYGYIWDGKKRGDGTKENYVTEKTVNYITKYIHKQDEDHKEYNSIILTSAGIGSGYLKRTDIKNNLFKKEKTKEIYTTKTGHKIGLPIYLRNKIYTEEEREKLWIEKIDKQERWVGKIKIDISQGEDLYYKVLERERSKAKRLGYQDNETNWKQKEYEEQRRNMLTQKRIDNAEKSLRGLGDAPESAESVNNGLRPSETWERRTE